MLVQEPLPEEQLAYHLFVSLPAPKIFDLCSVLGLVGKRVSQSRGF
jgi:hypothetical protein